MLTQEMVQAIADCIKYAQFKRGSWNPTLKHREETATVNAKHKTEKRAKVLFSPCDHPMLGQIDQILDQAYSYLTEERNSLGTHMKGMYQLKVCREIDVVAEMAKFKTQFDALYPQFLALYPSLKAAAPKANNGMHDERMWPSLEEVTKKFEFHFQVMGVPTDPSWAGFVEANAIIAVEVVTQKIMKALTRVADRCAASGGKLFQSVFSNLQELLDLVPDFNIIKDQKLDQLAREARAIAAQDKDDLKKDPGKKKSVAAEAQRLVGIFGGIKAIPSSEAVAEPSYHDDNKIGEVEEGETPDSQEPSFLDQMRELSIAV